MSTKPDYEAAAKAVVSVAGTGLGEDGYQKVWVDRHAEIIAHAAVDAALGGDPTAFAVAALIAEGGDLTWVQIDSWGLPVLGYSDAIKAEDDGNEDVRYLVFRIPVESAEAKETPR